MTKSAVIFDFNGTLFWDSDYQEKSWLKYLAYHDITLTKEEINFYIHGRNGKDTFELIFQKEFTKEEIDQLVEEKEKLYRQECLQNPMDLAPGALDLIKYLHGEKIPIAIATASGKANVEFFIEHFALLKYFKRENIIYDDGTVKGKPHPDIFLKAIKKLSASPGNVTIFEDSVSGIEAAKRCYVKNVVLINSNIQNDDKGVVSIANFSEFDRGLL
jgi:HAD superfamily hydrolase (TIGR01509 family)